MSRPRLSSLIVLLALALGLGLARPAAAEQAGASAGPAPSAALAPRSLPARHFIGQLKHSVQTLNNCGPASVVSVLSYYDFDVSQEAARRVLRPYAESRGMSEKVIPGYVAQFGLEGKVRVNGNEDLIKALVANDIPVIVLQWIRENWRLGHFRVVQGYDDAQGVFYVNDSLLGPNIAISYESFDARWDYNWSRYIPVYRPDQAPLVASLLGQDWTDKGMFERALPDIRRQIAAKPTDWQAWGRLVEALTGVERYQEALDTFDDYTARRGSAAPFMQGSGGFGGSSTNTTRLKLLTKLGRYDEALADIEKALARSNNNSYGSGSLWLYKAEALRGLGRYDEARAAYQRAIASDGPFGEAGERLKSLPE